MISCVLRLAALAPLAIVCAALAGAPGAPPSYSAWKNGPSADPSFFPIAVWLQNPSNAPRFKAAGINLYVGLWRGPTEAQLLALKAAGMRVICDQNEVGLQHLDDPTIAGWMHGDEPDNAQPKPGGGYGGPIPFTKTIADYEKTRKADPSRPVLLNLGQGVANDQWVGRAAKREDYPRYCEGADIISFDVYPVAGIDKKDGGNYLWYVPKGVDRLREWTADKKPVWNCIECTHISDPPAKATPEQVRSEVWMALIHGSRGLIYFVHEFKPRFKEAALLDDPEMLKAVTAINKQIRELAPVLNSPTVPNGAAAASSDPQVPVDVMVKRHGGATYVFAAGMRNAATRATFTVAGMQAGRVEVLGEDRTLVLKDGKLEDDFPPHGVHLYRIQN
jgi:hypothetical protein